MNGFSKILQTDFPITCTPDYCFTFNGKESDSEMKGEGNSLDFGARVYDSRIARFLSFDPYYSALPSISPFSYGANNPIIFIDNEGKNPILSIIGLTGLIAGSTILAELTGSSIAWTVTIEGKAGAAAVGSGLTGSIGLAVDPLGNYALIASGGAFAHIFDLGGNTNKNGNSSSDENDGPSEGGSWYFGGAAGISVDFSYLDQYNHISDFTGEASKFQVDIGTFSDFGGAIVTDPAKKQVKGLTLSFGAGISLGFGMIDNKTYVIGFTKRDLSNSSAALTKATKTMTEAYLKGAKEISATTEYIYSKNSEGQEKVDIYFIVKYKNSNGHVETKNFHAASFTKKSDVYVESSSVTQEGSNTN